MPRIFAYISLLILLTITCSCRNDSYDRQMASDIDRAQSLVDSLPDSTLTILSTIDIESLNGSKARAYYLTGCAKLSMQNFHDAMWSLLHAEKFSDYSEDYALLALTRLKMMELSDSLYDIESKHYYALSAGEAYDKFMEATDSTEPLTGLDGTEIDMARVIKRSSSLSLRAGSTPSASDSTDHGGKFIALLDIDALNEGHISDSIPLSMSDLHTIINRLWEHGDDHAAQQLLNSYILNYGTEGPACQFCNDKGDPVNPEQILVNRIITRRHIMESFQREVSYAMAKFNYGENLVKDQSLRLHKIHLWLSISLIVVLIAVILLIIRLNRLQRQRREAESIHTALELQTALSHSKNRCLTTLTHLCNTYYEGFNRDSVKSKAAKEALEAIETFADSPEFFTYLEDRLNMERDGLMARFRTALPDLKDADYRLYICNALGLSIPTICLLLKEKREVIYNRRLRLRTKIQSSDSPEIDTFLQYLR